MNSISVAEYKSKYAKKKRTTKPKRLNIKNESVGEAALALHLKSLRIDYEREFKFCSSRKWKADFHLIGKRILVEVEGGVWLGRLGRHTSGKGYLGDM